MSVFQVTYGDSAIVLGQPHGGTHVPETIFGRLNDRGQRLDDTDWHINQLYDGLLDGVTVVRSCIHRYVIDANRDPAGVSLYPGQNTTALCPTTDFDGEQIWQKGEAPSKDEILNRRDGFHTPYHQALAEELDRVKSHHGVAILYDCHSIRSRIPFLFDGELPVFSIGTNESTTCAKNIEATVLEVCNSTVDFNTVVNGRFKGGWTTRHYGQPQTHIHAIQMELAQRAYMNESFPWPYRPDRADKIRPYLSKTLNALNKLALSGALHA